MSLDRSTVHISGTDPSNPKNAEDLVHHLEHVRAGLANMVAELDKLKCFTGGIRDVLHYDQSYPDKRASLIAGEVQSEMRSLANLIEEAHDRTLHAINAVTGCGVNMRGKFEWRPPHERQPYR